MMLLMFYEIYEWMGGTDVCKDKVNSWVREWSIVNFSKINICDRGRYGGISKVCYRSYVSIFSCVRIISRVRANRRYIVSRCVKVIRIRSGLWSGDIRRI